MRRMSSNGGGGQESAMRWVLSLRLRSPGLIPRVITIIYKLYSTSAQLVHWYGTTVVTQHLQCHEASRNFPIAFFIINIVWLRYDLLVARLYAI